MCNLLLPETDIVRVSSFRNLSLLWPMTKNNPTLCVLIGVPFNSSYCGAEIQLQSHFSAPIGRPRTFRDSGGALRIQCWCFRHWEWWKEEARSCGPLFCSSSHPLRPTLWCKPKWRKRGNCSMCSWLEMKNWCGHTLRAFNELQHENYPLLVSMALSISQLCWKIMMIYTTQKQPLFWKASSLANS